MGDRYTWGSGAMIIMHVETNYHLSFLFVFDEVGLDGGIPHEVLRLVRAASRNGQHPRNAVGLHIRRGQAL